MAQEGILEEALIQSVPEETLMGEQGGVCWDGHSRGRGLEAGVVPHSYCLVIQREATA